MKLNKFVILLGVAVVAGLAFIMSSQKAPEKVEKNEKVEKSVDTKKVDTKKEKKAEEEKVSN